MIPVFMNYWQTHIMMFWKKFKDDTRLTEYWDIPEYLTDEDEERLNTADTQFYKTECEHFTKMAYEYYHQTLKKTVTPIDT